MNNPESNGKVFKKVATPKADNDRFYLLALTALLVAGLLIRLKNLSHPLRYDESFTFHYAWGRIWTYYTLPNNHVFYTMLLEGAVRLLGGCREALRLPAFLSSTCLIAGTAFLAKRAAGAWAGLLAAALVSFSAIEIEFGTSGRGYSTLALCLLGACICAFELISRPQSWRLWSGYAICCALGVYTIPIMLPAWVGLFLFLFLSFRHSRPDIIRLILASLFGAAMTALLYAPVIAHSGFAAIFGNRFVQPLSWSGVFHEFPLTVAELIDLWTLDRFLPLSLLILLAWATAYFHTKGKTRTFLLLFTVVIGTMGLLFLLGRRVPPIRSWSILNALFSTAGAVAFVSLARYFQEKQKIGFYFLMAVLIVGLPVGICRAAIQETFTAAFPDEFLETDQVVEKLADEGLLKGDIPLILCETGVLRVQLQVSLIEKFRSGRTSDRPYVKYLENEIPGKPLIVGVHSWDTDNPIKAYLHRPDLTGKLLAVYPQAYFMKFTPRSTETAPVRPVK